MALDLNTKKYSIDDLYQSPLIQALDESVPSADNNFTDGVSASSLQSGELQGNTVVTDGFLQSSNWVSGTSGWQLTPTSAEINSSTSIQNITLSTTGYIKGGQTAFNTGTGFWMGYDSSGTPGYKFSLGDPLGDYLYYDGENITLTGSLTFSGTLPWSQVTDDGGRPADSATVGADWGTNLSGIPGTLTTPSADGLYLSATYLGFYQTGAWRSYLDSSGNFYFKGDGNSSIDWNISTASTLTVKGKIVTGTGSDVATSYLTGTVGVANTDLAAIGWNQTCAFTVTDSDTVAWGAGTFRTAKGTSYSIGASNTGNMAAKTYIYLDIAVSTTAYQVTTTQTTAVGSGKVLIAVAQNGTTEARFMLFNDNQQNIDAANIVAGTITANEIAAATITGAKIATMDLTSKTITADTGTIGGWTLATTSLSSTSGGNTTTISNGTTSFSSGPTGSPTFSVTRAGALTATSATITGALTTGAGSSIGGGYLTAGSVASAAANLALRGWVQTCAFTVTDADTIAWGAGTFTSSDGTAYSISAGNTGNMTAKNYVYLDTAVSTTVYQKTTTAATATGNGKVLIAVCQNATAEAKFMLLNDNSYNIDAANIIAGSITANEIAASTITGAKIAATALDAMTITGATIRTASSGSRFQMNSTAFQGVNAAGSVVFETVISGADAGDVIMGDDSTGSYAKWDNSAGTFNIYGSNVDVFGGDGSDGALSISSGATNIDCGNSEIITKNYTSISITGTASLTFTNPHTKGTKIILKSQGGVTITSSANPTIDLRSMGGTNDGWNGLAPGSFGVSLAFIPNATVNAGGPGGGASTPGGSEGIAGAGSAANNWSIYHTTWSYGGLGGVKDAYSVLPGAGGGNVGSAAGGLGAGAMIIECGGNLNCSSIVNATGANGANGPSSGSRSGAGGGGGGAFVSIYTGTNTGSPTITVTGGNGGDPYDGFGGGGGDGGTGYTAIIQK